MHGSIFIFLKRFIKNNNNYSTWVQILENEGIASAWRPPQIY